MRTSSFLQLLTQTACVLISLGLAYNCQGAEKSSDLERVRSGVREYFSSIQSIDVQYQRWSTTWPDDKPHPGECGPLVAEWAEQGALKFLKIGPYPNKGFTPFQTFMTFDGQAGFYVDYEPSDISKIRSIHQTPQINGGYQDLLFLSPAVFYGRRFAHWDGTLLELLELPAAKVIAREEIEGSPCVHLQVANVRGISDFKFSCDVWLDEKKDYLPRLAVSRVIDPAPRLAEGQDSGWRYEIKEFLEAEDVLLRKKKWFPVVMTHADPYGKWRLKVLSVAINPQLPLAKFRPEIPKGTLVYDGDPIPYTPVRSFISGGEDAATALIDQRLNEAARLAPPLGPLVDARQEPAVNWNVVIGGVCLLTLVAAAIWRFTLGRS